MTSYEVVRKPILSEKSSLQREKDGQYSFWVSREAGKRDIKAAVEELFGVNVVKVCTSIMRGKLRRRGRFHSLTNKRKRAVVTLGEGQKLAIFEDQ